MRYESRVVEPKELADFLNGLDTNVMAVQFVLPLHHVDSYNRLITQFQVVYQVSDHVLENKGQTGTLGSK